jgi:hypothetical protein
MFIKGSHDSFEYLQYKSWPKEVLESKYQFDFQPLKVWNCFELHTCKWHATYHWKSLDEGYNFALNLTSSASLHKKLWAFKAMRVPISGLPMWNPMTK